MATGSIVAFYTLLSERLSWSRAPGNLLQRMKNERFAFFPDKAIKGKVAKNLGQLDSILPKSNPKVPSKPSKQNPPPGKARRGRNE